MPGTLRMESTEQAVWTGCHAWRGRCAQRGPAWRGPCAEGPVCAGGPCAEGLCIKGATCRGARVRRGAVRVEGAVHRWAVHQEGHARRGPCAQRGCAHGGAVCRHSRGCDDVVSQTAPPQGSSLPGLRSKVRLVSRSQRAAAVSGVPGLPSMVLPLVRESQGQATLGRAAAPPAVTATGWGLPQSSWSTPAYPQHDPHRVPWASPQTPFPSGSL